MNIESLKRYGYGLFFVSVSMFFLMIFPVPTWGQVVLAISGLLVALWLILLVIWEVWPRIISASGPIKVTSIPLSAASEREGYLYIVRVKDGIYYKIGRTRDVERRVQTFTVMLPFDIQLEHIIECDDAIRAERRLHEYFKEKRTRGEWFKLSRADLDLLKSIHKM